MCLLGFFILRWMVNRRDQQIKRLCERSFIGGVQKLVLQPVAELLAKDRAIH